MLASDKVSSSPESGHRIKRNLLTNINLYNFESTEANNSPYILTSPRSLKACSSANIRPIELLHRSVSEIAKDLNLPIQSVHHIYEDYERERIRKLEICKLVRKHMLQNCETDQVQKFPTQSSPNIFPNRETISRSSCYSRGDETPEFLFLRERKSRSPFSTPATPVSHYRSFKKEKNQLLRCNLSSSSSSISSVTVNSNEKHTRSKSVDCEKYKKYGSKKLIRRNTTNVKKKSNKYGSKLKNEIGKKYQMSEAERMNDQQLCWQIDNVKKSSTLFDNQKNTSKNTGGVIETKKSKNKQNMAEQNNFIQNCEKAINSKQDWMKSPKIKKGTQNVTKCASKPTVEFENDVKKSNDKFNESVRNRDFEKDKKVNEKQIEDCDGLSGLKNHDLRILDAMALKRELQKTQDDFAQRARIVWSSPLNEVQLPSSSKQKHLSEINNDCKQQQKPDCCHIPESITFDTYFNHIRNKMKQLKEDSLHKELHGEHVRQLARELQLGMEQWQDQVLLLQWQALQRARTNAKLHIENKRLKTQYENNERALLHALRLKNIQNMERLKKIHMKKEIEEKDGKIEKLKMKREREILDCRAQAYYTAELREQLRRTLTPETFDQKVNDVIVKTRFTNRSLTASPFVESHIRLG